MGQQSNMIYLASIRVIPIVIAITFHEAAHGFVARFLGDDTAWRLGRVSFNPLKHIDPVGTMLTPGFLLLLRSPFLFGYAKPMPVNFRALRNPRHDMVWGAAAGPAMNIALAILAALAFHLIGYMPVTAAQWVAENLKNRLPPAKFQSSHRAAESGLMRDIRQKFLLHPPTARTAQARADATGLCGAKRRRQTKLASQSLGGSSHYLPPRASRPTAG
jgi:hypothetical protein